MRNLRSGSPRKPQKGASSIGQNKQSLNPGGFGGQKQDLADLLKQAAEAKKPGNKR